MPSALNRLHVALKSIAVGVGNTDYLVADIDAKVTVNRSYLVQANNIGAVDSHKGTCGQGLLDGSHRHVGGQRQSLTLYVFLLQR